MSFAANNRAIKHVEDTIGTTRMRVVVMVCNEKGLDPFRDRRTVKQILIERVKNN